MTKTQINIVINQDSLSSVLDFDKEIRAAMRQLDAERRKEKTAIEAINKEQNSKGNTKDIEGPSTIFKKYPKQELTATASQTGLIGINGDIITMRAAFLPPTQSIQQPAILPSSVYHEPWGAYTSAFTWFYSPEYDPLWYPYNKWYAVDSTGFDIPPVAREKDFTWLSNAVIGFSIWLYLPLEQSGNFLTINPGGIVPKPQQITTFGISSVEIEGLRWPFTPKKLALYATLVTGAEAVGSSSQRTITGTIVLVLSDDPEDPDYLITWGYFFLTNGGLGNSGLQVGGRDFNGSVDYFRSENRVPDADGPQLQAGSEFNLSVIFTDNQIEFSLSSTENDPYFNVKFTTTNRRKPPTNLYCSFGMDVIYGRMSTLEDYVGPPEYGPKIGNIIVEVTE